MARSLAVVLVLTVVAALATACTTLVASYDPVFDTALNTLSEDSARFTAAAQAGGPERSYNSREAVAYYASTYNVLDRLTERARLTRGGVACPTDASLPSFVSAVPGKFQLPQDYAELDCREFQLYSVRFFVVQLDYAHETGGTLNRSEAHALGGTLQTAILGAIQTFLTNKPPS